MTDIGSGVTLQVRNDDEVLEPYRVAVISARVDSCPSSSRCLLISALSSARNSQYWYSLTCPPSYRAQCR